MVERSHLTQRCPGFGGGCFHLGRPEEDRSVAKTFCRGKHAQKGTNPLSICNVHVEFLHQSSREESFALTEKDSRKGEERIAQVIRKGMTERSFPPLAGRDDGGDDPCPSKPISNAKI